MSRPKKGEEHPREDLADKIKLMVAIGIPQEQIAGILKMSKENWEAFCASANQLRSKASRDLIDSAVWFCIP